MHVLTRLCVFSTLLMAASGCSTSKETIIPENGVPVEDVYFDTVNADGEKKAVGTESYVLKRRATMAELDKNPYVARNTLSPVYKKLDNPTLYIFSFPYLSDSGRVPVPAYITEFKMFERDEYAMPGELNLDMGGK
ncbi:TIGR03751 family conjugal transfer lipoprotein [Photobacterium angustum]|nr:TIGR03751 family conjugal transfer lipoprotein [Photobacterium angustum]